MDKKNFTQFVSNKTKLIAKEVIFLINDFPKTTPFYVIGKQIVRSATSTASNYRAVLRARSSKEFYSKISIVIEECDETLFWLELIEETNLVKSEKIEFLQNEVLQVLKIVSKARKTASEKKK